MVATYNFDSVYTFCLTLKCRLIICILGDFSCICYHPLIFFKINLF